MARVAAVMAGGGEVAPAFLPNWEEEGGEGDAKKSNKGKKESGTPKVRLLSPTGVARAHEPGPRGWNETYSQFQTWSRAGLNLTRYEEFWPGDWCGWEGMGGSLVLWSRRLNASFAYAPTELKARFWNARAATLLREFVRCAREAGATPEDQN